MTNRQLAFPAAGVLDTCLLAADQICRGVPYVPRLDTYMGPETPNPVLVKVQRGKCEIEVVLKDILGLTKINFNTCLNNDRLPVTIRFANEIGDVLIAAPIESEPRLPFKFYI